MVNVDILVPCFSGNVSSFSQFNMMQAMGLSYVTLVVLRDVPSVQNLPNICQEKMLYFVKFLCVLSVYTLYRYISLWSIINLDGAIKEQIYLNFSSHLNYSLYLALFLPFLLTIKRLFSFVIFLRNYFSHSA